MLKRVICLFLALLIMTSFIACRGTEENGSSEETSASPTDETTTFSPAPEEKFISEELIKDGKTEYVIVYDAEDTAVADAAKQFCISVRNKYGVKISLGSVQSEAKYEIVVGKVRDIAADVYGSMRGENDFAIKIEEGKLILCAANDVSYNYMFNYLENQMFSKIENGNLTITSEDNMIYSNSELRGTDYVDYLKAQNGGKLTTNDITKIFNGLEHTSKDGTTLPYRLYIPFDYTEEKTYPVLLFMHGAGERGSDNKAQLRLGLTNLFNLEDTPVKDAIIIAPQCPENQKWVDVSAWGEYTISETPESNEIKCALEIFDTVTSTYSVDSKRFYVTGISMGGMATWDMLMRHTEKFTAAVPICGSGDASSADVLKDFPIYTVHSLDDPTMPIIGTQSIVNAIRSAGGTKIQYEEINGYGHNVWDYTTSKASVYKWLFSQSK